jgi:uncharacterized OsmC-like protein
MCGEQTVKVHLPAGEESRMDKVIVQQDREFRVAIHSQSEGEADLHQVTHIHELTPYTMLLVSVGLCTTVVLHSYAQHHDVALDLAEVTVTYHREEQRDAKSGKPYMEWIEETVQLEGALSEDQHVRLERVAHQCSIRKMLEAGIEVRTL